MSVFEIVMLLCFGSAWPFSIFKAYKAGNNSGKSVIFLYIVLVGYAAGIIHKLKYSPDKVVLLYMFNTVMVFADIMLFYRNERLSAVNVPQKTNSQE